MISRQNCGDALFAKTSERPASTERIMLVNSHTYVTDPQGQGNCRAR